LTDAVELPRRGEGFERYRPYSPVYWGSARLVRAVTLAAERVAEMRPGGSPLVLGDLSARTGGQIPRHQSHRSGRDADLLWFVTTPSGAPVKNPGFLRIGSDGLAVIPGTGDYVRLDVEREWLLVRELVTSPEAGVQWLFCSKEIEAILIDYARARGERPEVIWRAETVLLQPGDSLAHDDHLHLRVACSPEEAVAGCEGGGPRWEWLPPLPRLSVDEQFIYEIAAQDPLADRPDDSESPQITEAGPQG
jgi:penicillin-insensitive murein endopeptidase